MKINYSIVEESWDENGFLGQLRSGLFNRNAYNTLCNELLKLQRVDFDVFEKEFIRVVWFIPIFMGRQRMYIKDIPLDEYDNLRENLEELIAGILGYP